MYETVSQTTYTNISYHTYLPQPQPDLFTNYGPNYPTFHPQPAYYPVPNAGFPAIQPLPKEATPSASRGTSMNMFGRISKSFKKKTKKPKVIPSQTGVSQSIICNLCKVECNSVHHYEKHLRGKKHNKKFKEMYASTVPSVVGSSQSGNNANETGASVGQCRPGVSSVPAHLEVKKQKLLESGTTAHSLRVCTICNVACNGEIVFAAHLIGKKHIAQERALTTGKIPSTSCEVCKISCSSTEGLVIHRQGKRHKKNLEILRNSISDITLPNSSSTAVGFVSVPTAAVDTAEAVQGTVPETEQAKKIGARLVEPMDLETKRRKIMESGVDAGAVRACVICNVVCNSEMMLNAHLAGQKHASMVKRAEARAALNIQPLLLPEDPV